MEARDVMGVADAAVALQVSQRRVRNLIAKGELEGVRVGRQLLLDGEAVRRRVAQAKHHGAGRPWSPDIAWAIMRHLDGDDAAWHALAPSRRAGLQRRLDAASVDELVGRTRNRADLVRARIHAGRSDRVRAAIRLPSGPAGAQLHGIGLSIGETLDGYLCREDLEGLHAHGLRIVPDGQLRLRVAPAAVLDGVAAVPRLAVAADLLDSDDVRDRAAASQLLAELR